MASTPAKICVICNLDCAGQPRMKDEQGRYAHQACAKKLQKSKAAPPPTPEPGPDNALGLGGNDDWDDILGDVGAGSDDYNPQAGMRPATSFNAPKVKRSASMPSVSLGWLVCPWAIAAILGGLGLVLTIGTFAEPTVYVGLAIYAVLLNLVFGLATALVAFRNGESGWGAAALLGIGCLPLYLAGLFYAYARSGNGRLQGVALGTLATFLLSFVGVSAFTNSDFYKELQAEEQAAIDTFMSDSGEMWQEAEPDTFAADGTPVNIIGLADTDALVQLCDAIIQSRQMNDAVPDGMRREYNRLLSFGESASEYPEDIVAEAQAWYDSLDEAARQKLEDGTFFDG